MTTGWFINHPVMGKVMSILLLMSQNKRPETLLLVMSVLKEKQAFLGGICIVFLLLLKKYVYFAERVTAEEIGNYIVEIYREAAMETDG